LEIKQAIGAVAFKMAAEYKRKSAELRNRLQKEGKSRLDALHRERPEISERTQKQYIFNHIADNYKMVVLFKTNNDQLNW